ncbi:MAG: C25 family cysteine peptidase [Planctomycetota bacterium]|jgi:hypothetical protein
MRCLIALCLLVLPALAQDIVVLTPEEFQPAIADWKAHRESQGHKVAFMAPGPEQRAQLAKLASKPKFVLIVGDVKQVPADIYPAVIIKKWEKDPRIFSDNRTADLDGDHLPDVAIGRIPADSPEEAKLMLGKVIAYEKDTDFTSWRRRINVVAGVGGFGAREDAAIESAATTFLKTNIPASYDLHVTYANLKSAYCPPPSQVMKITSERFNEGALFFAYIGHGWRNGFDRFKYKGIRYPIFTEDAAAELESKRGMPIAFLLCCSTGHFDGAPDCIAEVMVKRPRGPVAVIASSRVSMPYGNAPLAKELLQGLFQEHASTLGGALQAAKRRTMTLDRGDRQRNEIEQLATAFYEPNAKKREQERIEHLYLYNLLGDPAMRVPHPGRATVQAEDEALPGSELRVTVSKAIAGRYKLELVAERSPYRALRTGDSDEEFLRAYHNANKGVRVRVEGETTDGGITAKLALPKNLRPGKYDVRVWVEGQNGVAIGSKRIKVIEPE